MPSNPDRASYYNAHQRNPEARKFYNSAAWKNVRDAYIREHPICQRCNAAIAAHVHHKKPLGECTEAERLDPAFLMSVDLACHNVLTAQETTPEPTTAIGTIEPVEDAEFFYDAEAADKPIRFIEKFCRHYEGRKFAGQSFILLEWEKIIIRQIFGWLHRETKLRRFRELYLITAKGSGKTPLLAAIGLYMLLGDGEPAAHVISMASSFEQAALTFNAAKTYIAKSPELSRHKGINAKQYAIEAPHDSRWTTISGKPTGRSGPRPSCVIADEAHEWPQATGIAFDLLCANLFKRSQPLLMVATNAGSDRNCFAWTLHERAANVLAGTSDDKTLLPVIYEAPKELDWRSEEAARAANPSIPDIVSFEQLKGEQAKGEARYRRLYLSQWVTGSDKWLEMDKWDACIGTIDPEALKDAPRYLGLDLSNGDDLCAMTDVLMAPDHCYVIPRFWMPKATAERYQNLDLVPYLEWAEQGAIELLTQPTISIIVQQQIAQTIIDSHKVHPINAVAYDRAYAGGVIELVRAAGIKCEPVPQGWTLWGACQELERRLTEKSITIAANPVARFCASNVTLTNNKGSYWPRKPDAKGRAGKMNKIDFISALVTALTEARKTSFPPPAPHVGALMLSI